MLVAASIISCDVRRKDKIADDVETQKALALQDSTTVQIIDSAYNFGKVTDGLDVVDAIRGGDVMEKVVLLDWNWKRIDEIC